jgi:pantoate--beta-alanine ligase
VSTTSPTLPRVVHTIAELREVLAGHADVALVPTMGALHEGHLALVRHATERSTTVVVSIFVNPLQFAEQEDLGRYPRTLEADVLALAEWPSLIVFAPDVAELYPQAPIQTTVAAGPVASRFEGHSRAGHFNGVLTVVSKLLNIAHPRWVVFGQKDAQQVFLVRQMVKDLNFPVVVDIVETVRDPDGLALSSRNRFLDDKHRRAAIAIPNALEAAASSADLGIDAVLAAAQSVLMGESMVALDYLAVVVPSTFIPVNDDYRGKAIVLIAAEVDGIRLIDNEQIYLGA